MTARRGGADIARQLLLPAPLHLRLDRHGFERLDPVDALDEKGLVLGACASSQPIMIRLNASGRSVALPEFRRGVQRRCRGRRSVPTGAGLLFCRGVATRSSYLFKHALIQDAAYETLPRARRQELHRTAAQTIAAEFAALAEAQPELIARHWSGAGDAERAFAAWRKAGDAARSAMLFPKRRPLIGTRSTGSP
jgi:hypothetical protein